MKGHSMYAFRIDRVTHLTLCRQNASLCGMKVSNGIETNLRQGLICYECCHIEREAWVREWHSQYGILGPIRPVVDCQEEATNLEEEKLVA
jgi:hypothetical protein